jgi:hypothetical protein
MITLELNVRPPLENLSRAIHDSFEQLSQEARPLVRALGTKYVEYAREEAPRRSGRFSESISFQEFSDGQSFGFHGLSAKPIGHFIILGTKPHKIAPRNANALYFFWTKVGVYTVVPKGGGFKTHMAGGKLWIGKGFVQHPGTQPNPFPARALERLKADVDKLLQAIADRWVQIIHAGAGSR